MAAAVWELVEAVEKGQRALVEKYVAGGTNINGRSTSYYYDGRTPLHMAVYKNDLDMVELLISLGAKLNITDRDGYTPLERAEQYEHSDIANFLRNAKSGTQKSASYDISLLGDHVLVRSVSSKKSQRKLTEMFNFESRRYQVVHGWRTSKTEGFMPDISFNDLPREMLKTAFAQFTAAGGEADEDFVLNGTETEKLNLSGTQPVLEP